jgi:uncharacterized protein YjbI with pentapeptide repeats
VDLVGQNLANSSFQIAMLNNANLSQGNLTNSNFVETAMDGANLSGADARGANFYNATLTGANSDNLIQSNGHIAGLDLTAGASLVIRDYDGNPTTAPPNGPLPIVVDAHLTMNVTGTLRLAFDADSWDSTISFAPGIPVTRGGTLELTFAPEVSPATQIGRTIDLFDWAGVTPTGTFTITSPYSWNLSNLYTTGEVTLTAVPGIVPGDYNGNGTIDAADYVVWRKNGGTQAAYSIWRTNFGQPSGASTNMDGTPTSQSAVPECSSELLLLLGATLVALKGHRSALLGQSVR